MNKAKLYAGFRDGVPIGLGYFAVSFSLGITARNAGLDALQGFVASLFTLASAGEYAVFSLIAAGTGCLEIMMVTIVVNARYLLMSCALAQRLAPKVGTGKRLLMGACITDEIFGVSIAQPDPLNPIYTYGVTLVAAPLWALGTSLGIIMGNLLPGNIVSALSVALYGMFLAIIIPPSKTNKVVAGAVISSFILNYASQAIALFKNMSEGTRIIILTVAISAAAALLFPVKEEAQA